jgi:hypothetical protein
MVRGSLCGHADWPEGCNSTASGEDCDLDHAYLALIRSIQRARPSPVIHLITPPPLSLHCAYRMDMHATNRHLPSLVSRVAARAGLPPPIDAFGALGGRGQQRWPAGGCVTSLPQDDVNAQRCRLFCDTQSCDPMCPRGGSEPVTRDVDHADRVGWPCLRVNSHPNDAGYAALAATVHAALDGTRSQGEHGLTSYSEEDMEDTGGLLLNQDSDMLLLVVAVALCVVALQRFCTSGMTASGLRSGPQHGPQSAQRDRLARTVGAAPAAWVVSSRCRGSATRLL